MHLSAQVRREKLAKLLGSEGYDTLEQMAAAVVSDSVSPAICVECDATAEMEPDQDAGYCENCGKNAVVAALVLAGLI